MAMINPGDWAKVLQPTLATVQQDHIESCPITDEWAMYKPATPAPARCFSVKEIRRDWDYNHDTSMYVKGSYCVTREVVEDADDEVRVVPKWVYDADVFCDQLRVGPNIDEATFYKAAQPGLSTPWGYGEVHALKEVVAKAVANDCADVPKGITAFKALQLLDERAMAKCSPEQQAIDREQARKERIAFLRGELQFYQSENCHDLCVPILEEITRLKEEVEREMGDDSFVIKKCEDGSWFYGKLISPTDYGAEDYEVGLTIGEAATLPVGSNIIGSCNGKMVAFNGEGKVVPAKPGNGVARWYYVTKTTTNTDDAPANPDYVTVVEKRRKDGGVCYTDETGNLIKEIDGVHPFVAIDKDRMFVTSTIINTNVPSDWFNSMVSSGITHKPAPSRDNPAPTKPARKDTPLDLEVPTSFRIDDYFGVLLRLEDGTLEADSEVFVSEVGAKERARQLLYARKDVVSCATTTVWKRV